MATYGGQFTLTHELDGVDLFTGALLTYTDSNASSHVFSGKTQSVGGGLYASALFDSGAYFDLIGKYLHHDNEYTASFASLGTKDYSSHSWYAGAEVGYRYHLSEEAWVEPQMELVYGSVSGKSFVQDLPLPPHNATSCQYNMWYLIQLLMTLYVVSSP